MTNTTLTLSLHAADWEEVEDVIAAALYAYGYRGRIESEATGNVTDFDPAPGEIKEWMPARLEDLGVRIRQVLARVANGKRGTRASKNVGVLVVESEEAE